MNDSIRNKKEIYATLKAPFPIAYWKAAYREYLAERYIQALDTINKGFEGSDFVCKETVSFRDALILKAEIVSRSGKPEDCLELLDEYFGEESTSINQLDILIPRLRSYILIGRGSEVTETIERFLNELSFPVEEKAADMLYLLALSHYLAGNIESAQKYSEIANAIFSLADRAMESAETSNLLGRISFINGDYRECEKWYQRSYEYAIKVDSVRRAGNAKTNLGIAYYKIGKYQLSDKALNEGIRLYRKTSADLEICQAHIALGNVHRLTRDFEQARQYLLRAYTQATELKVPREECLALEFLGDVYRDEEKPDEARRYYARGMAIAREIAPEGDLVMELLRREGECLMLSGETKAALEPLFEARELARRIGDRFEEGVTLRCLAEAMQARSDLDAAESYADESVTLLRAIEAHHELAISHLVAAQLQLARGNAAARAGVVAEAQPRREKSREAEAGASRATTTTEDDGGTTVKEGLPISGIRSGSAEALQRLDRAWRHAVKAEHLCGGIGVSYWIERAQKMLSVIARRRVEELRRLKDETRKADKKQIIIAVSKPMREVLHLCDAFAPYDEPVLITGSTGVGKELVAQRIHARSLRKERPFVAVNVAAIPQTMFEREFFGHVKGAFSGAERDQPGFAALANGGTLFLDEIGEMTADAQVKLLRLLQDGTYQSLGSPEDRHTDVRLIAATNAPLQQRVEEGSFRADLYYRLKILEIAVPSLAERRDDIIPLLEHFLSQSANRPIRAQEYFNATSLRLLQRYDWPGNAREVATVARRAHITLTSEGRVEIELGRPPDRLVLTGPGSRVPPSASPEGVPGERPLSATRGEILLALEECAGNRTQAARKLGIGRATLYRLLRRYGLQDS